MLQANQLHFAAMAGVVLRSVLHVIFNLHLKVLISHYFSLFTIITQQVPDANTECFYRLSEWQLSYSQQVQQQHHKMAGSSDVDLPMAQLRQI